MSADSPYVAEIARMIGDVDGVDGIVALNGRIMRGAALALGSLGYPLPGLCRSDLHGQFAASLRGEGPRLVSSQPVYRLGYEAARLLLHAIDSPGLPTMQISLDSEVATFE